MCCGNPDPSVPQTELAANTEPVPPVDEKWYEVTYFDSTTEVVQGLDAVTNRTISLTNRPAGTTDMLGSTYRVVAGPATE